MKSKIFFSALLALLASGFLYAGKYSQSLIGFYAAIDAGDFEKAVMYLSPDVKATLPFSPKPFDMEGYRQLGMSMKAGFPDMHHKVLEVTEGKGAAAIKGVFTGTNTASLQGNPATGNRVETPFIGYFKFDKKGKITQVDILFDQASFNAQLMKGLPDPKMMAEKTIRELFVAMDAGQGDKFAMYCAPDFKISNPFLPEPSPIQAFQSILQAQKTAFPDMRHEITEIVSDGRNVVTYGTFKGTNTGTMMGNPPTGNKVAIPFLVLDQLDEKGQIVNRHVEFDSKAFEAQLMAGINPNAAAEATIRNFIAALDAGDLDKSLLYCSSNHTSWFSGKSYNTEEFKARIKAFKTGFPDIHRGIDQIYVNDNTITVRGVTTGTNKGVFAGKPATGKKVSVSWIGIYELDAAGKIEKAWVEYDTASAESQLKGDHAKNGISSTK